jgi:two-component system, probable response regulator PhcQ
MQRTVLLVDDDRALTEGIQRRLHHEKFRILCAGSGDEALRLLAGTTVDVLLSDEHMPNMSGVELLTEVHRRWPEVVTLMLSGKASAGTIVRALNQGQIFRFLIKPCDADEIAIALRQAMAHKRVIERCRELLPICRRMHDLLGAAERVHPGILRLAEAELKKVVVKADDFVNLEQLADRLAVEIDHGAEYMPLPLAVPPGSDALNGPTELEAVDISTARLPADADSVQRSP